MISGALVCFRVGTKVSSVGDAFYNNKGRRFLACQMPECQVGHFFRLFAATACIDKLVAGIPNAIKHMGGNQMSNKDAVRKVLDQVKADKRTSLTAPEGKVVCDAYGIPVPKEDVAKSA